MNLYMGYMSASGTEEQDLLQRVANQRAAMNRLYPGRKKGA